MLDGEVGDAAPRVDPEGGGEGVGGAGRKAGGATPAMHLVRRGRCEVERRVDRAQEEPTAMLAADEVGVLALPAQSRRLGQRLLHHRRRVDEHLEVAVTLGDDAAGARLQRLLYGVVIVPAPCVDRDAAAFRQVGRASGRERACPYVYIPVVAGSLKKKKNQQDMSDNK